MQCDKKHLNFDIINFFILYQHRINEREKR